MNFYLETYVRTSGFSSHSHLEAKNSSSLSTLQSEYIYTSLDPWYNFIYTFHADTLILAFFPLCRYAISVASLTIFDHAYLFNLDVSPKNLYR